PYTTLFRSHAHTQTHTRTHAHTLTQVRHAHSYTYTGQTRTLIHKHRSDTHAHTQTQVRHTQEPRGQTLLCSCLSNPRELESESSLHLRSHIKVFHPSRTPWPAPRASDLPPLRPGASD